MNLHRQKIQVNGIVQGVGFRPFVYRLARECNLSGFVNNNSHGVLIEIEGDQEGLSGFLRRLKTESPSLARIIQCTVEDIQPVGQNEFKIEQSDKAGRTHLTGYQHLRRLLARAVRAGEPALPLSLHQLYKLRAEIHHRRNHPVRPPVHIDETFSDVRSVFGRIP